VKKFLRQNGILLLVIALLLTILIGVSSAFLGGNANPLTNAANTIATPFRNGVSAALDWAEGVYNYVFYRDELERELDELRRQVAALEDQVRQGQEASLENDRLRALLDLQERRRDFVFETAQVTTRSTSNWTSTLTIGKGSAAGLQAGNCVVTETGVLVGVVSEVGLNWATVSTIINTDIEMGGIVTRTYSAGILEGDFALMGQGKLKLDYLPDGAQLLSGDEVLTSGKGDVYPSGLVVGQVDSLFTDSSGMTRYAVVLPAADLSSLTQVFVIKDFDVVE
jgi:rod shape-determining protein MreC